MAKTAQVCLEKTTLAFDKLYSYRIPPELEDSLLPGCRVTAPFGRGNASRQGVVMSLEEREDSVQLKTLLSQIDSQPLLNREMLWLMELLRETTFCSYYDALRVLIPAGIGVTIQTRCSLNRRWKGEETSLTDTQQAVIDI